MPEERDLPPGVQPKRDLAKEAKFKSEEIKETFPVIEFKSKFNPLYFVGSLVDFFYAKPIVAVQGLLENFRGPSNRIYYHRKFRRVPEIWECELNDSTCVYEAEIQFRRDKLVETEILEILKKDMETCCHSNPIVYGDVCEPLIKEYKEMKKNWMIKYGDLAHTLSARSVLNKQKNRLIETRYKERVGLNADLEWLYDDVPLSRFS
ncbi:NADH dehydrogenase [ubiquinone] 1 beta subcomplex subunit 10-like [Styela clava]|uniref:NADH dehydrogenase [ubiquinone] 1 beta subcomplex subunit 10-like n=1 Tax=Styela clava TaxID=7725 RepID=UPI0019393DA5|nr:NADH dehydrogenase [ubiquinone] 1 beta subcomplex subunit 10-like [Styela clava]